MKKALLFVKTKFEILFFAIILFLYALYSVLDVFLSSQMYIFDANRTAPKVVLVCLIVVLLFSSILYLFYYRFSFKTLLKPHFLPFTLFAIYVLLTIFLSFLSGVNSSNKTQFFNYTSYYLLFFLFGIYFYFLRKKNTSILLIKIFFGVVLALYATIIVFFYCKITTTPKNNGLYQAPILAHVFVLIPSFLSLRLYLKSNLSILLLYLLIFILSLMSTKRSLFIGIVMFAIFELFFFMNASNTIKNKKRFLIVLIIIMGVIMLSFIAINLITNGRLLYRFRPDVFFSGSGRIDIWNDTIKILSSFSFKEWVFGRGTAAVLHTIGSGAHNDFLEYLVDFGIIGLFHFILFEASYLLLLVVVLLKSNKKQLNNNYLPLTIIQFCSYTFLLNLLSAFFSNTNMLLFAFLGLAISEYEIDKGIKEDAQ